MPLIMVRTILHPPESVEEAVITRLAYEKLHKAVAKLPTSQERRIQAFFFDGLSYVQIAKREGVRG